MRNMIKPLILSATIGLASATAVADLKLGLDSAPYPPFYQANPSGVFEGWEVEIGNAICAAMSEKCEWVGVAWDGIIPALLAKKIDVIFGSMSITEERMKTIAFSDKYYNTPAAIIATQGSGIDGSPESVKGKIIGVQVSTTHQNYTEAYYQETAADIKVYQDFNEHNQDLIAGRVDAVVGDSLAFSEFLQSPEGQGFEVAGTMVDEAIHGAGAGAGLRKEDSELLEKINAAIASIRADGSYDEISAKYFDFNIYGQ